MKTSASVNAELHPEQNEQAVATSIVNGIRSSLSTGYGLGPFVARLALAIVIFPHGAQKLLGWFGGYGFGGTMGFFTQSMGIPWVLAFGAILVEFLAPLLLVAGLATRFAALSLGVVMAVAMTTVHLPHGFFMNWYGAQAGEGIEFFILAVGLSLSLVSSGGGRFSADRGLAKQ